MKLVYLKDLNEFAKKFTSRFGENIPSKPEDVGAYPKTGGDVNGDVTVYAKGNDKSEIQDVKIRKNRIDIFKELTGEKDSSIIIERGKRLEAREFEKAGVVGNKLFLGFYAANPDGTISVTNWLDFNNADGEPSLDIKKLEHLGVRAEDLIAYFSRIILSNYSGGQNNPLDIFSNAPLVIRTDDASGNHAVVMLERDKLQIGTTDTAEHTIEDLMDKENTASHPSVGMRIEQDDAKFTFYSKPDGIEFDLVDLVNNCWHNTSNGAYKFVPIGSRLASNNKGVKSSAAESAWQGIFRQNTDFVLKYRVSSETGYDKLTVMLDGATIVDAVSGDGTEQTYTCRLKAGKHTLYAKYQKDGSTDKFEDRAYLEFANVVVSLDEIQYESEPVRDSPLPITSGGVYAAIENIEAGVLNEVTDDDIAKIINGTYTE